MDVIKQYMDGDSINCVNLLKPGSETRWCTVDKYLMGLVKRQVCGNNKMRIRLLFVTLFWRRI